MDKKNKLKHSIEIDFDSLAVPEIHIRQKHNNEPKKDKDNSEDNKHSVEISYDNLAVPEIHIKHKK